MSHDVIICLPSHSKRIYPVRDIDFAANLPFLFFKTVFFLKVIVYDPKDDPYGLHHAIMEACKCKLVSSRYFLLQNRICNSDNRTMLNYNPA